MATKILAVDDKNTSYIFESSGEILINNNSKGFGRIITPIMNIGLRRPILFIMEGKKLSTDRLKLCAIDD